MLIKGGGGGGISCIYCRRIDVMIIDGRLDNKYPNSLLSYLVIRVRFHVC